MHAWEARMRAIGHGERRDIAAAAALAIARNASPDPGLGVDHDDPLELADGDQVTITPADYGKVPVSGRLVTLTLEEVAVEREDPQVGTVVTHFPRLGYRIARC
jgi:hypothetical protein